ncbi:MAG: hypothetical protein ACRD44_09430 [Bryobacteraceae bacterium]
MAALDVHHYAQHLRTRWHVPALAAAVAFAVTLGVSWSIQKQYTATARILIEPPATGDGRTAMSVSPIYVEMLRSYEHFALSDSLFLRALDKFTLRRQQPARSIESWKRILEVEIPRNTKILEVRVKLPDAKKAQEVAQFIAEETAAMARTVSRDSDSETTRDLEAQVADAQRVRNEAEDAWRKIAADATIEGLEVDLQALRSRRVRTERALLTAESAVAELTARKSLTPVESGRLDAARARAGYLRQELKAMDVDLLRISRSTEERQARRDQAAVRKTSAQAAFQRITDRLIEARAMAGSRGERLRVIDPGIVPERASSPNVRLNVMAGVLLAAAASLLYLTLEFAWRRPL